jgi:hypothetical protein
LGSLAKKPKKSAADVVGIADAPEAAGQQAGQPAAAAKSKKRRKRKAGAGGEEAQLPAEEAARRRRQRELRQLALRLREQGKDYNPKKHRKHKPRRKVCRKAPRPICSRALRPTHRCYATRATPPFRCLCVLQRPLRAPRRWPSS